MAWLGQSGFWIKNSFGEVLIIDPYLSDLAERVFHLKHLNQRVVEPENLIPCHFWTLARHRGNPYDFELAMAALAPDCFAYTMCHGEFITFPAEKGLIAE